MRYKEMVETAKKAGATNEQKMWQSIDDIDELFAKLKKAHPSLFWEYMRNEHCILYEGHYTEDFAEYDVDDMMWTDKDGKKHRGEYWSVEEVEEATKNLHFQPKVNKWDKYVAFNAFHADLNKELDDAAIIKAAFAFWFNDEDYPDDTKIWTYMKAKNEKEAKN